MIPTQSDSLCLECGLCCNGVIFADVQLEAEDDSQRLKSLGLALAVRRSDRHTEAGTSAAKFPQPCAMFDGCRCRIYADRPRYCRQFECLLLKNAQAGRIERDAALRVIRTARQRADKVRRLLRELGDENEHVALSLRFRQTKRRMESSALEDETAESFGRLTLAVHDLNMLVSEAFYPKP